MKMLKPEAIPSISVGWSTSDSNKYALNTSTIAGTSRPFIRDGNLPKPILKLIVDVVELILKLIPKELAFNFDGLGKNEGARFRKEMMSQLKECFTGDGRNVLHFRAEGITIIIPLSIGWHRDVLNCLSKFFASVISINVQVPINEDTVPDLSFFSHWLAENNCIDSFPVSVILYGRHRNATFCRNMAKTEIYRSLDPMRAVIVNGLVDQMYTSVDYKTDVFNNVNFPKLWEKKSKKEDKSIFNGRMWKREPGFDRMVRHYFNQKPFHSF